MTKLYLSYIGKKIAGFFFPDDGKWQNWQNCIFPTLEKKIHDFSFPIIKSAKKSGSSWKNPWHSISKSHLGDYRILQSASGADFHPFFQFHTSILTLRLESDQVLHSSTHFPMPFFHWSLSIKGSQRVLKAVFFWPSFVTSPSLLCHYYPGQNCMTSLVPQEYQRQESCFGAFTMTPIQSQGRSSVGKCYSVIIVKWITKTKKI